MLEVLEPRAGQGRAPDVFRPAEWVPMRTYGEEQEVDFAIVGTGAGGGTLACKLAEAGFSVVAFEAGPFWRPLEDFVSDESSQGGLYWTDERITGGADPVELGSNNSGRGVGGSTVHYTMIALRWRPDWFKSRSVLGYGRDWPISFDELEPYYEEAEEALKISGPIRYPWGRRRRRYPYREHEVNAAGLVLARGCEAIGIKWSPLPLATLSAPRGMAHPCVYRGFCAYGCSTNAKQSVLVTFIPRALKAGAEVRDLAMVGRIEMGKDGHASGLTYHRKGEWRHQKARNVVVAGYSIETPRLLLNSRCGRFPEGLANENGLVGTHVMIHSGPGVWGVMDEEVRCYKAPPCMAVTEHWNYDDDEKKDFHGGYAFMSQGPLPVGWAQAQAINRGMWGMKLRREMTRYNHIAGLRIVGETEPQRHNRIEVADETDQFGLPIPRMTFSYSENDRRLMKHSIGSMRQVLEGAGAKELWVDDDTSHLMGGCRMGEDPKDSVVNKDGRSWSIPNLWICDGSLFPTSGGVNPSLTIQALACRMGERISEMAKKGEL
ncbi:MAG TPA: GMC family oxidoreductase [Sphingomicrobium sp.]|nr:GMC family oxidoreductase [Sphingomicrobium sp.]